MTEKEKQQIQVLLDNGFRYGQIAKVLNLSVNSVKSYCYRQRGNVEMPSQMVSPCEQCNKDILQKKGRKKKRFCSDQCRMLWWNKHTNLPERASNREYICKHCGATFYANPHKMRKYCSHQCYIEDRYGGESN